MQATSARLYHLFRCVKATEPGGPNVLSVTDFPIHGLKLQPDEVLVRMSYAGVNFIDAYYRTGLYPKSPSAHRKRSLEVAEPTTSMFPFIMGEEGSGAVVQCGGPDLKEAWLNKRVAFFRNEIGSYSSFTVVKQSDLFEIPTAVSDKDAAAALLQGCTAHYLTHDSHPVKAGEVVLVHAAAGGTGLLVTQMAKQLGAGLVIGVCGGAEKAALARSVGKCDEVIDYSATPDWEQEVLRITNQAKCHVIFDGVGKSTFAGSLRSLRPRGHMVTFGNASGPIDPIAPLILSTHGSLSLTRPKLQDYMLTREEAAARVASVFKMIAEGKLATRIHSTYKLDKAAEAHTDLEARATMGKLLINCQE